MKTLSRTTLVVLLILLGLPSVIHVNANPETVETIVPYEFPSGLINIIQHSENPATPFWNWIEERYPLFKLNYTVQNDGWLSIHTYQFNGTKPEILLNGDETYATKNPIFNGKVFSGDFFMLALYPEEHLDSTFSVEVDNTALTIYEVYNWEDLIGEIVFTETLRPEINASISWTPASPVEGDSMIFSGLGMMPGYSWSWSLDGMDVNIINSDSHFITPSLDGGDYTISLFVEDAFGYTHSVNRSFTVEPNLESLLYDPALTSVDVVDFYCPTSVEPEAISDAQVSLSFSTPVPRDIRVIVMDVSTGVELSSVEDQINGDGSKTYSLSFVSSATGMNLETRAEFLHNGEWIIGGAVEAVYLSVFSPVSTSRFIPGFPAIGVTLGLLVYILKRKFW